MVKSNLDPKVLEGKIREYNNAYRRGEPEITDVEFDALVEQLHAVNPDADWFKKGVNDEVSGRKETLPIPMYSLEKVKTYDEIVRWVKSCGLKNEDRLIITPKFDGISLCVDEYNKKAWTRGNGEVGQNCTSHFEQMINHGFKDVKRTEGYYTFGEAIFRNSTFLTLKKRTNYKSARNAVAGLVNSPTVSPNMRDVQYIRYGYSNEDWDKVSMIAFMNDNSSVKVRYVETFVETIIHSEKMFNEYMDNIFKGITNDYKCDGLVIDVDSAKIRKELGRLPNGNPRYAIAYKNPDWSEREETEVENVRWQISKDGRLSPVIDITPVELCGATVSKCTAYNARYVKDNFIMPGSRVIICRSGDVIPKHIFTVSWPTLKSCLPDKCPICGKPLEMDRNNVDLICFNKNCDGVMLAKCVYFFNTLDFEEFGEPTIKKLFNAGYKTPDSILLLSEEDLKKIEGIGNVGAKVLSRQFENLKKKGTNFAKLLTAYNKFGGVIAEKTCQKILDGLKLYTCKDVADFAKECDESWAADIEDKVEGVGFNTALAFVLGIEDWWVNDDDSAHIPITYYGLEEKTFEGQMTVVFTGFRSPDTEKKLTDMGHKIGSSVSKKTTCLVVKEKGLGTIKEKKAEQYGIPVFTFEEFKEKFNV